MIKSDKGRIVFWKQLHRQGKYPSGSRSDSIRFLSAFICVKVLFFLICIGSPQALASEPIPHAQRIISLSPATTEILFALGAGDRIIGVTSFCDHPEEAAGDRIIGVTSFCDHPEEAKKKQKIGGMSNPSLEAIVALKPDLVVMTTDGNPQEVDERLRTMGLRTYVWTARKLSELPGGIRALASVIRAQARGEKLAGEIETGIQRSLVKDRSSLRLKVLYIVWPEPLLVAGPGTAIDDAIVLLGMNNAAAGARTAYPRFSIEELIRQAPEVVFIGKGSGMDMQAVSQGILKKLATVPAVRNNKVCYVSDSLYRLGPRVVQGIEELAACIK
ncbi:MAG: periplasmic binding protein [Nitrospirae bacterium]|nr:periplasmic binding protein [Nitrospirota bacterium]